MSPNRRPRRLSAEPATIAVPKLSPTGSRQHDRDPVVAVWPDGIDEETTMPTASRLS